MALIPPFFSDCVVAIGFDNNVTGKPEYVASGFFYGQLVPHTEPGQYRTYLVTNRHVLAGKTKAYVRVNPSSSGPAKGYELALTEASWRSHRLKSVDVAVVPINFNFLQGDSAAAHFFQSNDHALDVSGLKQTGTSEGDGVFVLGFPMGIVGKTRNSVFVRSGVLARIRDTLSVNTRPFIVDASVFPGNSGGPVVSKPEVITIQGTMASSKANLIGVVAGYLTYEEVAFSRQSNKPRVLFEENSGLSTVFSVDCIRQTIRQFERAQATQTPLTPKHSTRAETEDPAPASVT